MANNFDDKNLFGDSFDLFQSDSNNLFGNNVTNKSTQSTTPKASNNNLQNQKSSTPKTDFGFDNNLFGDGFGNNDLFGSTTLPKNDNTQQPKQSATKTVQPPSNIDFGFDDNSLFGETTLPQSEEIKQDVPANLFEEKTLDSGDIEQQEIAEPEVETEEDSAENTEEIAETQEEFEENVEESENEESVDENLEQQDIDTEQTIEETENTLEKQKTKSKSKKSKGSKNKKEKESAEVVEEKQEQKQIKKEKVKQPKPEKTPEQKEKEKKRNKIIILASLILLVVIIGIVVGVILSNQPGEKMKTPTLEVYQRETGTILVVDEQEKAYGYQVVVSQTGKEDTVFSSDNGTIELRLFFNEPGVFDVKVRVLGDCEENHSEYSETKTIVNYVKLATPTVFRNGNIISWNKVDGAEYYKMYYRVNTVYNTVEFMEIPAVNSVETFDLTELNYFGAGLYPISVVAIASGEYILNSDYSQTINYVYCTELDAPIIARYDSSSHTLMFATDANKTQAERYLIVASLDGGSELANHYVYADELEKTQISYQGVDAIVYTVRLNEILSGEPMNLTIKALGDGIYSLDSDAINVTNL